MAVRIIAIETKPSCVGGIITGGETAEADGISRVLGTAGGERFVYSTHAGRWHTALEVGTRVYKGLPLGQVDRQLVTAPMDGVLRGIARDDVLVPEGVKLIEIDPRGRDASWTGIDDRGAAIAEATLRAVQELKSKQARAAKPELRIVRSAKDIEIE